MSQTPITSQEAWLKVLGKGMITLPKTWREELGFTTGDVVKAKKMGDNIIIEARQRVVPYRLYSNEEINEFLKEDKIPPALSQKARDKLLAKSD